MSRLTAEEVLEVVENMNKNEQGGSDRVDSLIVDLTLSAFSFAAQYLTEEMGVSHDRALPIAAKLADTMVTAEFMRKSGAASTGTLLSILAELKWNNEHKWGAL